MKKIFLGLIIAICCPIQAADTFVSFVRTAHGVPIVDEGMPTGIVVDETENKGVLMALDNLQADVERVCGKVPVVKRWGDGEKNLPANCRLCVGTIGTPLIRYLISKGYVNKASLEGKKEKYVLTCVDVGRGGKSPLVVVAGSDRRGTIYGIYELSRQMGVSPWYWWADVPTAHHDEVFVRQGTFTDGEPAVAYRGIFLNDEAPCLR